MLVTSAPAKLSIGGETLLEFVKGLKNFERRNLVENSLKSVEFFVEQNDDPSLLLFKNRTATRPDN